MDIIFFGLVLFLIALPFWGAIALLKMLFSKRINLPTPPTNQSKGDDIDGMNNGDYYNGPSGYSATGGYQNSYYGRQFEDHSDEGFEN